MDCYGIDFITADDFDPYEDEHTWRPSWDDDDRAYDRWVDECMNNGIDPLDPFDSDKTEWIYDVPVGLMLDDETEDDIEF